MSPIAPLGPEPAPAPDSDDELTENSPGNIFEDSIGPVESEPSSTTTTTPAGDQVVEQLQESMATSSELVGKAAEAADASAKATTELQKTVKDTTDALKTLTEAQTKTETARDPQERYTTAASEHQQKRKKRKTVRQGWTWEDRGAMCPLYHPEKSQAEKSLDEKLDEEEAVEEDIMNPLFF